MSHVPYDMWVGYYQLLLAQLEVHPRRLLDVCCGTGLVAEILAGEGYDVTGFDISPHMIAEAKRKARAQDSGISYHVADAAELDLDNSFEGAYSFFDSLNYITDPERLQMAIGRVARHLEPGGSFVFDVNTAYAFEKQMFDQKEKSPKAPIQYEWTGDYDPVTKLIRVQMDFERNGQKFEEVHHQRAYDIDELTSWLRAAGFQGIQIYDSYTLIPPRKKSDRLHFACVLG